MFAGKSSALDFGSWAARAASLDNVTLLRTAERLRQREASAGSRKEAARLADERSVYDDEISSRYNFVTAGAVAVA
jgi:hypothetical protein